MEKEVSARELDEVPESVEENPDCVLPSGGPTLKTQKCDRVIYEGADQSFKEDITAFSRCPQDPSDVVIQQDSWYCGSAASGEDPEDLSCRLQPQMSTDEHTAQFIGHEGGGGEEEEDDDDEEEEEDGQGRSQNETIKEHHMNGEPDWRSVGSGKRCRSRNAGGGCVSEQSSSFSALFSSSVPRGTAASSGSRHKQARRRNHHHQPPGRARRRPGTPLASTFKELLSDSLGSWSISCVHMVIELIVTITHYCGVGVETGGLTLYHLGLRLFVKVTDVPGMKADAQRVLERLRGAGAVLAGRGARWAAWAQQVASSCFGLVCVLALVGAGWAQGVLARLAGERGRRCWAACQDSRLWKWAVSLLARLRARFRRDRRPPPSASGPGSPAGRAGRCQPGQELQRLLAFAQVPEDELDPFTVLGVEVHATEAELKRAYRGLAVQVHPDKNKHPRAGEAFKVLRAAWDIVSNPETRREYELKRMAATELSKSMNDFFTKLQEDLKEAMNTMMCTKCEGKHKRFEMDREPSEARFCAECSRCHSAEEGDLWAESSMLGLRITYFACMDGKVYDITEWAGCQRIAISPDTHRVPYHISFGSKNNSGSSRQRVPSEHAAAPGNPADLQDFFNRIFQGGPSAAAADNMAPNGGFFPPGPPHHPPAAPTAPPFPPPPTPQTGLFFGPGAPHRPEPGESWAESSKAPPRRRKKVRKPFQR